MHLVVDEATGAFSVSDGYHALASILLLRLNLLHELCILKQANFIEEFLTSLLIIQLILFLFVKPILITLQLEMNTFRPNIDWITFDTYLIIF